VTPTAAGVTDRGPAAPSQVGSDAHRAARGPRATASGPPGAAAGRAPAAACSFGATAPKPWTTAT
jgi:hypothetical protein